MRSPRTLGGFQPFMALFLLTVGCNQPPGAPTVIIEPAEPGTEDDLSAGIAKEAEDPNGKDTVNYSFAWHQAGELRADITDSVVPYGVTSKGETWEVVVTPNDGTEDGATGSAAVTIQNTPPTAEASVAPSAPLATDDLEAQATGQDADGDTVTFGYAWTNDGEATSYAGEIVPATATSRGQVWEVTVTPNDGTDLGSPATASVDIENTAPEVLSADLGPDPAYEGSTLELALDLSDEDGDEVGVGYAWYVNGSLVLEGEDAQLTGEHFDKGEQVRVVVTPNDGFVDGEGLTSNTIEIVNTPPILLGASLDPAEVFEASTVTCVPTGWSDDDDDSESYEYAWYVEGTELSSDETIDGDSFDRGDDLYCQVTPYDGEEYGESVSSSVLAVSNTAPEITSATLSSTSPTAAETISVTVEGASDDDGDSITLTYDWYVNGSSAAAVPSLSGTYFDKGDTIYVEVTPSDGSDAGATVTSDTATAVNSLPVVSALVLSPSEPYTDDSLVAAATTTDADGDTVSLGYAWYVDGAAVGASGNTLDGASWFDKGQTGYVVVTPNHGEADGASETSDLVDVLNSPPSTPTVAITPLEPIAGEDDLLCEILVDSTDDDADSFVYGFAWTVNGAAHTGMQVDTATSSLVPSTETSDAETWVCSVTPDDGDDQGAPGLASVDIGEGGVEECEYPDSSLTVSTGPASGTTFSPSYYAMDWIGTVADDVLYDWENDGSAAPAYLEFEFFDSSATSVCSVYYDMDAAIPATGWSTDSGGTLYAAWEVPLTGGYTTCTAISPATWGTNDLRDLIESWTWGVAVGEMINMYAPLRKAVMGGGSDWTNDWEPYIYSSYAYSDLYGTAYEASYGFGWEAECGTLSEDSGGNNINLLAPTGSPLNEGIYEGRGYYLFYASSLVP